MITGFVDSVVLALMPEVGLDLAKAVGGSLVEGFPTERYIEKMDQSGVEISILLASKGGAHPLPGGGTFDRWEIPVESVKRVIDRYPDRFRALVGVDPTDPTASLREIEKAIKDNGFVGVHLYLTGGRRRPITRCTGRFMRSASNSMFRSRCRSAAPLFRSCRRSGDQQRLRWSRSISHN